MEEENQRCSYCGRGDGRHKPSCKQETAEHKVEYTPSRERRFDISDDAFTRERIEAVAGVYERLKRDVPAFVGINLFGSITQGKELDEVSAKATDVDLVAYVDVSLLDGVPEEKQEDFWKREASKIRNEIECTLRSVHGLSEAENERQRNDIFIFLIRDGSIQQWYEGTYIRDGKGRDYVGMFFGMNIGADINRYRLNFLEYLKDLGDEGERRWRDFISDVAKKEKKVDSGNEVIDLYPKTLDEAMAYYGSNPQFDTEQFVYA